MTTRDWTQELSAYIDGELTSDQAAALEAQLAEDAELRSLERKLRGAVALLKTMSAPAPSQALRRAVLVGIDAPTFRDRLTGWWTWRNLVPVGALAAAGLVAVLVLREPASSRSLPCDEEQLYLAMNLEVVEDYDVLGLESPEDVDVVLRLHDVRSLQ
jgi:anti-sigma factor RsiW